MKRIMRPKFLWLLFVLLAMGSMLFFVDNNKKPTTYSEANLSDFLDADKLKEPQAVYNFEANSENILNRFPTKEDSVLCDKFEYLITGSVTASNYTDFYSLAVALWELNRVAEAENMFLKMMDSKEPFFTEPYVYSSDILGDTTKNAYGYGSGAWHYKNLASRYLAKIYIKKKMFEKALQFVELADKKYAMVQNCGTGHRSYRTEIDALYSLCQAGMNN